MKRTIFYSWQSDLPNNTNRGFIQAALEEAAKLIATDLDIEPVIDRDTQGIPGSPNITEAILKKIAACDVFVADVTLINLTSSERRTPNPNVLIELGYAMHALGDDRIILVMNTAYGRIEDLPFDLKMRRVIPYRTASDATDKATERRRLASTLKEAITTAIASIPADTLPTATNAAIEIPTLNSILLQARFYKRALRLIDDISHLRHHYLTHNPRPFEYDQQRSALRGRFDDDYHVFERDMTAAEHLLKETHAATPATTEQEQITVILNAIHAVTTTVQALAKESVNRLDPIDLRTIRQDLKSEAEHAAETLSTLAARRLRILQRA